MQLESVESVLDPHTLTSKPGRLLELNDIGKVRIAAHRALFADPYADNRQTGAFILIDSATNETVAAGMIARAGQHVQTADERSHELKAGSALQPKSLVSPRERRERFGQQGALIWLTGLPGSGRWTLAYALERRLFDQGSTAHVIDPVSYTHLTLPTIYSV